MCFIQKFYSAIIWRVSPVCWAPHTTFVPWRIHILVGKHRGVDTPAQCNSAVMKWCVYKRVAAGVIEDAVREWYQLALAALDSFDLFLEGMAIRSIPGDGQRRQHEQRHRVWKNTCTLLIWAALGLSQPWKRHTWFPTAWSLVRALQESTQPSGVLARRRGWTSHPRGMFTGDWSGARGKALGRVWHMSPGVKRMNYWCLTLICTNLTVRCWLYLPRCQDFAILVMNNSWLLFDR